MHSKSNHSQTYSCGYSPLKGMLILISSLKLSITPYAAGPESWGQYMAIYNVAVYCHLTFIRGVPIFVARLIHEIKNPTNNETWEAVWYWYIAIYCPQLSGPAA
jgi:hypothetical protein